jgi:hypothetical protein
VALSGPSPATPLQKQTWDDPDEFGQNATGNRRELVSVLNFTLHAPHFTLASSPSEFSSQQSEIFP